MSVHNFQLSGLVNTYFQMSSMSGPISDLYIDAVDASIAEVHCHFAMTYAQYFFFLGFLIMWVLQETYPLETKYI